MLHLIPWANARMMGMLWLAVLVGGTLPGRAAPLPNGPADPAILRDTTRVYNLGQCWAILTDRRPDAREHPLTLAQVQSSAYAGQFVPSHDPVPNYESKPYDYWLRCRVRSEAHPGTAWLFEAGLPNMHTMELLLLADDGQIWRRAVNNDQLSYAVASQAANVVLPLQPGQTYTLYAHLRGNVFWFGISERTRYLENNREVDIEAAAYFGILLGLLVYNLLLYLMVHDRSYLYYVGFTASFALLQADMMGYLRWFWLHDVSDFAQTVIQNTWLSFTLLFSLLTGRSFLETKRLLPRLDQALRLALLLVPLPVLSNWLDQRNPLAMAPIFVPLLVSLVLLVAGVWQLLAGYRPARYYMAGWSLLIVAIFLYYMRTLGILQPSIFTEYGVRATSALEVILLSLGLAYRINLARQEKQVAQQTALLALTEKEEVQRSANDTLRQRADELQTAYADLRESLETTDRLQEVDELKTRFFTGISHELRTPLTLILGPLEQVMRQPEAAPLAPELQLMSRHGQRLLTLINQLLDIARLEAGQVQLQACATDLAAFTQSLVAAFASSAAAKNVRLSAELPATLLAYVDRDQLEKVLTNLLSNALKFTDAGGNITARLSATAEAATLTITDTGCGIAASHLPKVFDRFYQADGSTRRRHEGSGIGLALVKELVALHHGTVAVSSELGQGSTFMVRLPLGTAHLTPEQIVPAPPENEELGMRNEGLEMRNEELGMRNEELANDNSSFLIPHSSLIEDDPRPLILVVDDHADMRAYVATCLGPEFRLLQAADGQAAISQANAAIPDLILTDLMMPVMDGLELCRRFKTDERTSHIPVVMLTARASDESRLEGLALGADDYLIKPFRPAELRTRVQNLIQQRRQLRERFSREITLQPRDISVTPADEVFLNRTLAVVEANLADPDFGVEAFASELAMGRVQLFRKLKALTDQAPTDFVRVVRLRRAAQLLEAGAGTVSDVAYAVGFNNLSYFSKCFRDLYGHTPSDHLAAAITPS